LPLPSGPTETLIACLNLKEWYINILMNANNHQQLRPPVRAVRLSDQVAAQLQDLVLDRVFKPGEKLPSERELCELLGVSRTVVREAVRSLVVKGLLQVRPGGGMEVRAPDTALVSELMSVMLRTGEGEIAFAHVQEVRRLLEVENAGLAAERRNETDLAQMEEQLRAMIEHENEPHLWAEADVAFHAAIAAATHNPLYPVLLGTIVELLMEVRLTGITLPGTAQIAHRYHVPIFERIKAPDRTGARKAMLDHLRESEATFQKASIVKRLKSSQRAPAPNPGS
jgi:GntR family transcriptional repressor for pyruvate dehydrogenase complex